MFDKVVVSGLEWYQVVKSGESQNKNKYTH